MRSLRPSASDAFQVVRTNLLVALAGLERPVVVVSSALPREGKTTMCIGLAHAIASTGMPVTVVDVDVRHPDAHRMLGARNDFGVTDVLLGRRTLEESFQAVGEAGGVRFLAAGGPVANPAQLLGTPRARELLERVATDGGIALVDAPPVLSLADTQVIGRLATGVVLVVNANRTPVPVTRHAKDALTRSQTRLLGVVLNRFTPDPVTETTLGPRDGIVLDSGARNGEHRPVRT